MLAQRKIVIASILFAQLGCRNHDKPAPPPTPTPPTTVAPPQAAAPKRLGLDQWLRDVGTPALARKPAKLETAELLTTHLDGDIDVDLRTVAAMREAVDEDHVIVDPHDLSMALKFHTDHDSFRTTLIAALDHVFGAPTAVVSAVGLPTLQYRSGDNLLQLEILDSHTWLLKAAPTFATNDNGYLPLWPVPAQADCATVGNKPQLLGVGARIPVGTSEAAVLQRLRKLAADADERGTINAGIGDDPTSADAGSRLRWQFNREGIAKLEYDLDTATRWRLLHCWHEAALPAPTWYDDKQHLTYSLLDKTLTIERYRPLANVLTTLAQLALRTTKPTQAPMPSPSHTETGDMFYRVRDNGISVEAEHNHNLTRQLDVMQPMWGDPVAQRDTQGRPQLVFKHAALMVTIVENDDGTHYTMELDGPTQ